MTSFNDKYDCILLDLDGTLVESPKKKFLLYNTIRLFRRFVKIFGYLRTVSIIRKSIEAMLKNDGTHGMNNYELLIQTCHQLSGAPKEIIQHELDEYYQQDFLSWSKLFTQVPMSKEFVKKAKARGKRIYIWTNPIWPEFNVKKRLEWAGFDVQDFLGFTHSQNSVGSKPNVEYFLHALRLFGLDPNRCVLIGDSEVKDGPARNVGIHTIIISQNKAQAWQDLIQNLAD